MTNDRLLSLAGAFETPLYVFDADDFRRRVRLVKNALGDRIRLCYSIKANPFLLRCLPEEISFLEVCSPGELTVCENAAARLDTIVFSGVNKTRDCVERAMDDGVAVFTAESPLHCEHIEAAAAQRGIEVPVLMRLTSDNQFGMDADLIVELAARREREYPHIRFVGLHYFSGTQKKRPTLIGRELEKMDALAQRVREETRIVFTHMEYGPGLWIDYFGDDPDAAEEALLAEAASVIRPMGEKYVLTVEMGRYYSAPCGAYLTTVMDTKTNCGYHYAVVDGGLHQMNYDGQMKGTKVPDIRRLTGREGADEDWCIVGSLCTPNDVLVRRVSMPAPERGDILAFMRTGGYSICEGFAFLLSRDLPAVVIDSAADGARLVREHIRLDPLNTPK